MDQVVHPLADDLALRMRIVPGALSRATWGFVGPAMSRTFFTASGPQ
ncbi:MAG: hypothetical protein ABR915_05815 [Thermoguttaceae bacterium]